MAILPLSQGGTGSDLSATGGTSEVLMQTSSGANVTVGQLAASDLSNGTTGSGDVVLATGATANVKELNGVVFADQFAGADAGAKINAAIAALGSGGGVVDARGLTGSQTITSPVVVNAPVTVLLGAATFANTANQAPWQITSEGATIQGIQAGTPGGSNSPTILQSSFSSGEVVLFNISAGSKGGKLKDVKIDGTSTASYGIIVGTNLAGQPGWNVIEDVSITNVPTGILIEPNCQNLRVNRVNMSGITGLCVDGGGGQLRDVEFLSCRMISSGGTGGVFVFGTNDTVAGNVSSGIRLIGCDCETSAATNTYLGVVYNVHNFLISGGWYESDNNSSYTTQIILGGTAKPTSPCIMGAHFEGDGNVSYAIELNNVLFPTIIGNQFQDINTKVVKNTSGSSNAVIIGNSNGGTAGISIDSLTGITMYTSNSTVANDALIVGHGIILAGAPASVAAGQLGLGNGTATTATAGGTGALPATVLGYIKASLGGTTIKIPYYSN